MLSRIASLLIGILTLTGAVSAAEIEKDFADPPPQARVRCFWWWLNSNVNEAAITRDLEQMKAKHMGGALIFDAGGAASPVPAGPTYMTDRWRALFKHAVKEADRLGLELSLSIQSGWNLGGPIVTPEQASKGLVWSERIVSGGRKFEGALPMPKRRDNFYRDVAVLAWKARGGSQPTLTLQASTERNEMPAARACDGDEGTFWCSSGRNPGEGPTEKKPEWIALNLPQALAVSGIEVLGRPGYGPRQGEVQFSADGKTFKRIKSFSMANSKSARIEFGPVTAASFRLLITSSYDKGGIENTRNVQIAEIALLSEGRKINAAGAVKPLKLLAIKTAAAEFGGSTPDCTPLLTDDPDKPGEEDAKLAEVVDLSAKLKPDGSLDWDIPAGNWHVLRMGYTTSGGHVSTCSKGWEGPAVDYLDSGVLQSYWDRAVEPLLKDVGPLAGKALKYVHTDSWEVGGANWTANFRAEFKKRRGYDLLPYLPIIAGKIIEGRTVSNRFLCDFRRTIGDCIVDNHYRLFAELAHKHNMGTHPESGGPHGAPIDALRCLGYNDLPTMEFWAKAKTHRVADDARLFVKQAASAAHTTGRTLVGAEAFTTVGPHWEETLWDNLKPTFDKVCCEGLNLAMWHQFTCSPAEMGLPGQEYFAGTHFNPQITWWEQAGAFNMYLNRCQALLQRGRFVADAVYYYGDTVPNFVKLKRSDPAKVLPGFDYDVMSIDALLQAHVDETGRIVLASGMTYRVMVLPEHGILSLQSLKKIAELARAGATIIGPKPTRTPGLEGYPQCDVELASIAHELWGAADGKSVMVNKPGKGRVIWGKTARDVLMEDGVPLDLTWKSGSDNPELDFIHRSDGDAEIFFISNQLGRTEDLICEFRVTGKTPELWSPTSGSVRRVAAYLQEKGRTRLGLRLEPYGSTFVIFRGKARAPELGQMMHSDLALVPDLHVGGREAYWTLDDKVWERRFESAAPIDGPWTVSFQKDRGAPDSAKFEELRSWTDHADAGIKYFSGTATYSREIDIPQNSVGEGKVLLLDLGSLREIAEVKVNGKDLGVLWRPPFVVDITSAAKAGANAIEVRVTNFWPNRLIGDQNVPAEQRICKTNVVKFKKDSPLVPSGLFGPLRIANVQAREVKSEIRDAP